MSAPARRSARHRIVPIGMTVALIAACLGLAGVVGSVCWTQRITLGGATLRVPVVPALKVATTGFGGRLLHGRRVESPVGVISMRWDDNQGQLELECSPCLIVFPALSEEPLRLSSVRVTVARHADRLWGDFDVGELRGTWQGVLQDGQLALRGEMPDVPLSALLALFKGRIPEASTVRIDGTAAASATWKLPSGRLRAEPRLRIDRVEGLGTEVLRHGTPAIGCPRAQVNRPAEVIQLEAVPAPEILHDGARMLRAAVIAAEDQKFHRHAGFDNEAIGAWLAVNADRQTIVGGASTISQQLAKLLYVGGERTHVRKLRELLYATEMERTLGKARILQLYLAVAPWGSGVCGADEAAHHYFGKAVDELTVPEAAWMAGLLRNPAHPGAATHLNRVRWIVDQMTTVPRARRNAALEELSRTPSQPNGSVASGTASPA